MRPRRVGPGCKSLQGLKHFPRITSAWQRLVTWAPRVVGHIYFELFISLLIVIGLVVLAQEQMLPKGSPERRSFELASMTITSIFYVELLLRRAASPTWWEFWQECWLDVLAVIPGFSALKLTGAVRLLRLLRLIRVIKFLLRSPSMRQTGRVTRLAESAILIGLLATAVVVGTVGLTGYEHGVIFKGDDIFDAFWRTLFTFFSVQYVEEFPKTVGGKLVALSVIVAGAGFFAVVTGMTTAVVARKLREGENRFEVFLMENMEGHFIFCGWNASSLATLRQIQLDTQSKQRDVVVVCEHDQLEGRDSLPHPDKVRSVKDDFTRVAVLKKVNVEKAAVAIFFNDTFGGRSPQDADARTVLGALTLEKMCPQVHTCAEIASLESEPHLRMGKVDEVVVSGELAGSLLAQAALDVVGARILQVLLSPSNDCNLKIAPVPPDQIGKTFSEILSGYHATTGMIPVAVMSNNGSVRINRPDYRFQSGDRLYCIVGAIDF